MKTTLMMLGMMLAVTGCDTMAQPAGGYPVMAASCAPRVSSGGLADSFSDGLYEARCRQPVIVVPQAPQAPAPVAPRNCQVLRYSNGAAQVICR